MHDTHSSHAQRFECVVRAQRHRMLTLSMHNLKSWKVWAALMANASLLLDTLTHLHW